MFKGRLIDSESTELYDKLRRRQQILMVVPIIPIGLAISFYQIPMWGEVAMIGLYGIAILLMVRNFKRLKAVRGNDVIEIDQQEIRIKTIPGQKGEVIRLHELDKIVLKGKYVAHETLNEVGHELSGKSSRNFVILHQNNQERQFNFEIDSSYMVHQLQKLAESWKKQGFHLEMITS